VGEEIESLEDHSDLGSLLTGGAIGQFPESSSISATANQLTIDEDPAAARSLEVIQASQKCGLTRSRWSQYADDIAH
jgi:hypothetical protein